MKKNLSRAISGLACLGVLVCSVLPVQAVAPGSCTHSVYADSVTPVKTGIYDYREDGHYAQYGVMHSCLNCGWAVYVDTYYMFERYHEWETTLFEITRENGVTTRKYSCKIGGCPRVQKLTYGVE